ncbi:MAG TPA: ABC transporter permease [Planctomycetota bacterium]|nr:ABC transporter permease [Planctomycetota bacterium]
MNFVAWRMLTGDRTKYLGIIMGLTFASLLITQQAAVFLGLMTRTYAAITDIGGADVWVMDPKVMFIDDIKPLQDTELYRVRGVEGVAWALPLYKGLLKARLPSGTFQNCIVVGLDDATLMGGPAEMLQGSLADLRRADGVIVDENGARGKLARKPAGPDGPSVPLAVGDTLELNDHRAIVVGICRVSRTFQSQPVVYTTYSRATQFAPRERKLLSFVLARTAAGQDAHTVSARIEAATGLKALPRDEFKHMTMEYYLKYTGIPINFGVAVVLGFIVGLAIAGQTFFNFTLDNLKHFGALKAMGAGNGLLLRMILMQAAVVGAIGYGVGVGTAALVGFLTRNSELAFYMPWQLLLVSAGAVTFICLLSAGLAIRKVIRLEPAIVFRS